MAGLEGTIKTPVGVVQKKTALIVGGGFVVLVAIVWYRQQQMDGAPDDQLADPDAPINPATGYPYGSPEDAAALAAQAGYVSPPANDPTGGGSGNIPPSNIGYASNGQWVQGVIQYMMSNDLVQDPSQLSSALGKYITGAYATDAEVGLIQQAIAVQGFPPLSGSNGYPPSINRTPVTTPPPVVKPAEPTPKAVTGIKQVRVDKRGVSLDWTPAAGAKGYKLYVNGKQSGNTVLWSNAYVNLPKSGTTYTVGVAGVFGSKSVTGPMNTTRVTTKR